MSCAKSHGVFFADVPAGLVDDRQPVRIGVLAKADIRSGRNDLASDVLQVLRGRLRRMFELSIRVAADEHDLAAERFQELHSQQASRATIGIKQNAELPGANGLGIHNCDEQAQMLARRVRQGFQLSS